MDGPHGGMRVSHGTREFVALDHLKRLREAPIDLVALFAVIIGFDFAIAVGPTGGAVRVLFGLLLVTFAPGYLVVSILSPEDRQRLPLLETPDKRFARDRLERIALAVAISFMLGPLFGLGLAALGISYTSDLVLVLLNTLLVFGIIVAAYRRLQVPPEQRFSVTVHRRVLSSILAEFRKPTVHGVLNLVLLAVVVAAAATMAFAIAAPQDGEQTTSLALLGENESGSLVAGDYPRTLTADGNESFVVEVTNREGERTSYTVVATLQRVEPNGTAVTAQRELTRFQGTVDAGQQWRQTHTVEPTLTGQRLRLVYLLYEDDAPANPDIESAYRSVYVWVSVSSGTV